MDKTYVMAEGDKTKKVFNVVLSKKNRVVASYCLIGNHKELVDEKGTTTTNS